MYAEDKRSTSASLDDGRVEQVTSGRDRGAGIRVVKGDTTGFAHTADLSESGLAAAAAAAAAAASQGGGGARTVALGPAGRHAVNTIGQFPDDVSKASKVELLRRVDEAARSVGPEIVQVSAGYGDSRKRVLIANTDGRARRRRSGSGADADQRDRQRRHRDADRFPVDGPHGRLGGLRLDRRRGARPRRGPPGDHQAGRPTGAVGRAAGRDPPWHRRGAVPRGLRARVGGRPSSPRVRACTAARSASWSHRRS